MPFKSTIRVPSEVLDALLSLTELTNAYAVRTATEAARAEASGEEQRAKGQA